MTERKPQGFSLVKSKKESKILHISAGYDEIWNRVFTACGKDWKRLKEVNMVLCEDCACALQKAELDVRDMNRCPCCNNLTFTHSEQELD